MSVSRQDNSCGVSNQQTVPCRFTTPHHKEGFELFLDTIVAMEEVWVVTAWQTVQWMRAPATTDTVHDFKPFQCDYKVTTATAGGGNI